MVVVLIEAPTLAAEIKEDVIRLLRERLAEAEAGKIQAVLIIGKNTGTGWFDCRSGVIDFADGVGYLEILKHEWIEGYLAQQRAVDP